MNPNSSHQQWSEWVFQIRAAEHPSFQPAVDNIRRMMTVLFGHAGQVKVKRSKQRWDVTFQVETTRESVCDPLWRQTVRTRIEAFVAQGWKKGCVVNWREPRLLAGPTEDGKPAAQWLILPDIGSDLRVWGVS